MAKNKRIDMSTNRFHTPLQQHEIDRISKLREELGKSYGTMYNYAKAGNWPADVCLKIYRLTDGEITATRMRPRLFANLPGHIKLADKVVQIIDFGIPPELEEMCILIMNCLQELDSVVYDDLIDRLALTEAGERIVNQRLAHTKFNVG